MKYLLLISILFFFVRAHASGEEKVRTRLVIVDAIDGQVLIGAAVKVEGVPETFYTDPDGAIELSIPITNEMSLAVSYISYEDTGLKLSAVPSSGVIALQPR